MCVSKGCEPVDADAPREMPRKSKLSLTSGYEGSVGSPQERHRFLPNH